MQEFETIEIHTYQTIYTPHWSHTHTKYLWMLAFPAFAVVVCFLFCLCNFICYVLLAIIKQGPLLPIHNIWCTLLTAELEIRFNLLSYKTFIMCLMIYFKVIDKHIKMKNKKERWKTGASLNQKPPAMNLQ